MQYTTKGFVVTITSFFGTFKRLYVFRKISFILPSNCIMQYIFYTLKHDFEKKKQIADVKIDIVSIVLKQKKLSLCLVW